MPTDFPQEQEKQSLWFEHLPIPLFASVMGIAGLGLLWKKSSEVMGTPLWIAEAIFLMAGFIFCSLFALYGIKLFKNRQAARAEWNNPVSCNFFPAITISLLLFSMILLPYSKGFGEILFFTGSISHLFLSVIIMRRWITKPHDIDQINPAWFIPVVGNIIVPLPATILGHLEFGWFYYSLGIVFWVIMFTFVLQKLFFHKPLPEKLFPTLFIFLAPPAVGFLSYDSLSEINSIDAFSKILFYFSVVTFLILASMGNKFLSLSYGLPFWAFTFPMDAFSLANLQYIHKLQVNTLWIESWMWFLLIATTLLILVVSGRTVQAMKNGKIFVPAK